MHSHRDGTVSADQAGDRTEGCSVVGAARRGCVTVRSAGSLAGGEGRRNRCALPGSICDRKNEFVRQCGLLVCGVVGGRDLAVLQIAAVLGASIVPAQGRSGAQICSGVGTGIALRNLRLVLGNVEAGSVEQIEDVERVEQADALGYLEALPQREVHPLLERLAEDVALIAGSKVGFVDVLRIASGGNRDALFTRLQEVDRDLGWVCLLYTSRCV